MDVLLLPSLHALLLSVRRDVLLFGALLLPLGGFQGELTAFVLREPAPTHTHSRVLLSHGIAFLGASGEESGDCGTNNSDEKTHSWLPLNETNERTWGEAARGGAGGTEGWMFARKAVPWESINYSVN